MLKAVGTLGLALAWSALTQPDTARFLLAAAVLVLATNVFNLLDLRPGRSVKAFVLLGAALTLGAGDTEPLLDLGLWCGPIVVAGLARRARARACWATPAPTSSASSRASGSCSSLDTHRPRDRAGRARSDHRLRGAALDQRAGRAHPGTSPPRLTRETASCLTPRASLAYIFVTGGVVSSLGKGIAAASIGRLLVARGLSVGLQKFDPYINVDPGTMSPYQHGEVFVTEDGAETDLDLGHYERFTDVNTTRASNVTAGGIYNTVIQRERRGDYLGATVQVVPHITDEIKQRIKLIAETNDVDVVITEIGGTVGDIESLPFLEAIRQFPVDVGRRNCMFIHLTLVPYIGHAGELKTKPTQHSVNELRRIGIQPDMLLCRTECELSTDIRKKIALFASLPVEAVVSAKDVDNIYKVPLWYHEQGVDDFICEHFGLERAGRRPLRAGEAMLGSADAATRPVRIALVGKYVQLEDAYKSVTEALRHSGYLHGGEIEIDWVDSETLDSDERALRAASAAPTASSSPAASAAAASRARSAPCASRASSRIPYLGICLGHADRGLRVRPPRRRHARRQLDRVRHRDRVAGDRPAARAEGGRRPRRDDAPRRRPDQAPRGHERARALRARPSSTSATATATRCRSACASGSRPPASSSPARRPTSASSRSSSCRATSTRSSSPRSSTPSSSRGPSARRRCSASSSARRCSARERRRGARPGGRGPGQPRQRPDAAGSRCGPPPRSSAAG